MSNQVIIHCQDSLLNVLNNSGLIYFESDYNDEIDVFVDNIEELEDSELCEHYGLDYNQVNCIELI